MPLMQLVLVVCSLITNECRKDEIPTEAVLPMQCMAAANEWAMQHPNWRVMRFSCVAGREV
jgi:hypothetical protein